MTLLLINSRQFVCLLHLWHVTKDPILGAGAGLFKAFPLMPLIQRIGDAAALRARRP